MKKKREKKWTKRKSTKKKSIIAFPLEIMYYDIILWTRGKRERERKKHIELYANKHNYQFNYRVSNNVIAMFALWISIIYYFSACLIVCHTFGLFLGLLRLFLNKNKYGEEGACMVMQLNSPIFMHDLCIPNVSRLTRESSCPPPLFEMHISPPLPSSLLLSYYTLKN